MNESLIEQKMDKCVHFTGLFGHETCAAGVRYDEVTVKHEPMPYKDSTGKEYTSSQSRPCIGKYNHCGVVCAKRVAFTREQAEQADAAFRESIRFLGEARKAITAATGNRGGVGVITCPKCGGKLHYGQASTNKHVHASCETKGCLSWME